jgi:hypothetical protein
MGHLVANEGWGTIDLNTSNGCVFICEDWRYNWNLWPGVKEPWTHTQKQATHRRIDRQGGGLWSNRIHLGVTGRSELARRLNTHGAFVNFDVRWSLQPTAHWSVTVWKMPLGSGPTNLHRSFVRHHSRQVELNTADLIPRSAGNSAGGSTSNFLTAPHEYGHTIGPTGHNLGDEYGALSSYLGDTHSMMNIGREIRRRHVEEIVVALNRLAPGTIFNANRLPL